MLHAHTEQFDIYDEVCTLSHVGRLHHHSYYVEYSSSTCDVGGGGDEGSGGGVDGGDDEGDACSCTGVLYVLDRIHICCGDGDGDGNGSL